MFSLLSKQGRFSKGGAQLISGSYDALYSEVTGMFDQNTFYILCEQFNTWIVGMWSEPESYIDNEIHYKRFKKLVSLNLVQFNIGYVT